MAARNRCSATLRDGSGCNTWAREDGLCAYHSRQLNGGAATVEPAATEPLPVEPLPVEPQPSETPEAKGGLRRTFQAAADANTDGMISSLLEVAGLNKPWKFRCPKADCGYEFTAAVPDGNARVKAIEKLIELGYGPAPKDTAANAAAEVDLGVDPYTLDSDQIRARIEALSRAYPEAAAQHATRVAEELGRERTQTRRVSGVIPRKQRQRP